MSRNSCCLRFRRWLLAILHQPIPPLQSHLALTLHMQLETSLCGAALAPPVRPHQIRRPHLPDPASIPAVRGFPRGSPLPFLGSKISHLKHFSDQNRALPRLKHPQIGLKCVFNHPQAQKPLPGITPKKSIFGPIQPYRGPL